VDVRGPDRDAVAAHDAGRDEGAGRAQRRPTEFGEAQLHRTLFERAAIGEAPSCALDELRNRRLDRHAGSWLHTIRIVS